MNELMWMVGGVIAGSAANALIDRLPKNISWLSGRSKCDTCKHELEWPDLIPVISYLILGGKCRYCRSPIPWRNLAVEVFMSIGFVAITMFTKVFPQQVVLAAILFVTIIIAVMDWETKLVSELMVGLWAGLVVCGQVMMGIEWQNSVAGLITSIIVIGGIWAISRAKAMGFGDVEIAAVIGWWLGWQNLLVALWVAFVLGAMVGLIRLVNRQAKLKSEMAFGPFLVLGSWSAFLFGAQIWKIWGL